MAIYFFPLPFLGAGLLWLVLLAVLRRKHKRLRYLVIFSIFWWYLMLVAALTLFPVYLPLEGETRQSLSEILARINLVPFHQNPAVRYSFRLRSEMVANILMTIPFGLLLPLVIRARVWLFPLFALGIGLGIELAQLVLNLYSGLSFRVTDINDVIFNFTGAMIGFSSYLISRGLVWLARRLAGRLRAGAKR